jgi:hypothetical protein
VDGDLLGEPVAVWAVTTPVDAMVGLATPAAEEVDEEQA